MSNTRRNQSNQNAPSVIVMDCQKFSFITVPIEGKAAQVLLVIFVVVKDLC